MLVVIDVGNSHTVMGGVYREGGELIQHWRLSTHLNLTVDECGLFFIIFFTLIICSIKR